MRSSRTSQFPSHHSFEQLGMQPDRGQVDTRCPVPNRAAGSAEMGGALRSRGEASLSSGTSYADARRRLV